MYKMSNFGPWSTASRLLTGSHLHGEMGEMQENGTETQEVALSPDIEIRKYKDAYAIYAQIPGVRTKDLELSIEDNKLTFSGKISALVGESSEKERTVTVQESKEASKQDSAAVSEQKSESGEKTVYSEFSGAHQFRRTLVLDASQFVLDQVRAELADGILKLRVPLKEKSKPRTIPIQ